MILTVAFSLLFYSLALSIDFYSSHQCQYPYGLLDNSGQVRPNVAADCRMLLSHLPARYARTPNANAPIANSLPFLPRGQVSHGACHLRLIEYTGNLPGGSDIPWVPDAEAPPSPPRDERWILLEWTEIAAVARDLVDDCLEHRLGGYGQILSQWNKVKVVIGPNQNTDWLWGARLSKLKDLMISNPYSAAERKQLRWSSAFYEV